MPPLRNWRIRMHGFPEAFRHGSVTIRAVAELMPLFYKELLRADQIDCALRGACDKGITASVR